MRVRSKQKEKTHQAIMNTTKHLIEKNGFVSVSTKMISSEANVAQGSIFLHFRTKNALFDQIVIGVLTSIKSDILLIHKKVTSLEGYIRLFLETLNHEENMLARIYQNLSELDENIQLEVSQFEVAIKDVFFDVLESRKESVNIVNSFVAIDAFYAQMKEYLLNKDTFSQQNAVLEKKTGRLLKLSKLLF
jgi:AcrR family transcriptional regulator